MEDNKDLENNLFESDNAGETQILSEKGTEDGENVVLKDNDGNVVLKDNDGEVKTVFVQENEDETADLEGEGIPDKLVISYDDPANPDKKKEVGGKKEDDGNKRKKELIKTLIIVGAVAAALVVILVIALSGGEKKPESGGDATESDVVDTLNGTTKKGESTTAVNGKVVTDEAGNTVIAETDEKGKVITNSDHSPAVATTIAPVNGNEINADVLDDNPSGTTGATGKYTPGQGEQTSIYYLPNGETLIITIEDEEGWSSEIYFPGDNSDDD